MLVVKVREGARILFTPCVEVVVLAIYGWSVKLGFVDPTADDDSSSPTSASTIANRCPGYYCFPQGGRRMFVLNRAEGQRARIGRDLNIAVLAIEDRTVRLGWFASFGMPD